jgi:hypothetical protein
MAEEKNTSEIPYPTDEAKLLEMKAFLELQDNRIEVLECLDTYAYFFPDWLVKITEGIQSIIDYKQKRNIPCDDEKEVLSNVGYFFTKMAYFSSLISDWHRGMALGQEETEKFFNRFSSGEEF